MDHQKSGLRMRYWLFKPNHNINCFQDLVLEQFHPICSMYGISTYIYYKCMVKKKRLHSFNRNTHTSDFMGGSLQPSRSLFMSNLPLMDKQIHPNRLIMSNILPTTLINTVFQTVFQPNLNWLAGLCASTVLHTSQK